MQLAAVERQLQQRGLAVSSGNHVQSRAGLAHSGRMGRRLPSSYGPNATLWVQGVVAIQFHPEPGCLVTADYRQGFEPPEMVKRRLAIVISKPIKARARLCTIVPLSATPPNPPMPYHHRIVIPFDLPPSWGERKRWVKGDMVNAVGFHRLDLLRMGKDRGGKRQYQVTPIPPDQLRAVRRCVLHGLGLSSLTRHL